MKSPSKPKEDPSVAVMRERQIEDLAKLDEQENIKIKRMLNASRGTRMYSGSPLSRGAPSNTAGKPLYSPRGTGGGGVAGGAAAPGYGRSNARGGNRMGSV